MDTENKKARVIAYYLPQFHPIPENDEWWGKGFTEWTNVGKAKPLFRGHYQPRVPADLGYYDLRVAETRDAQAEMAREYGIEGFCYWHYWFGNGKRLLERPFDEVLSSGKPDFPFCLAWANESWKGFSHGLKNRDVLIEQEYLGADDYVSHFYSILPAFKDPRYIKVNGKVLFQIFKPNQIPDLTFFIQLWRDLALQNGLEGIYFVAHHPSCIDFNYKTEEDSFHYLLDSGFDAVNFVRLTKFLEERSFYEKVKRTLLKKIFNFPRIYSYKKFVPFFTNSLDKNPKAIPTLIPGWDHSPRSGKEGLIMRNSTPKLFASHVKMVMSNVENKNKEENIVFIKSWNEWAEGNYMEPDLKWGRSFLDVLKNELI
jgi:hypothetical protein